MKRYIMLLLSFWTCLAVQAQTSVYGTVEDGTGKSVPGASVTLLRRQAAEVYEDRRPGSLPNEYRGIAKGRFLADRLYRICQDGRERQRREQRT